jgi:hypothetical protein
LRGTADWEGPPGIYLLLLPFPWPYPFTNSPFSAPGKKAKGHKKTAKTKGKKEKEEEEKNQKPTGKSAKRGGRALTVDEGKIATREWKRSSRHNWHRNWHINLGGRRRKADWVGTKDLHRK